MANIVEVHFTSFQNLDSDGNPVGDRNLGYRIFDDYDADYNNTFDSIEEMKAAGLTADKIFDYIDAKHDKFSEIVRERGVMLNDQYLPPPAEEG